MNISKQTEEYNNYTVSHRTNSQTEEAATRERVTAREFAQALAALEVQKERSERALQDTVPIGEALQQLDITASAAQILAEVQAQRLRQAKEQGILKRNRYQSKRRLLPLAMTGALLLFLSGVGLISLRQGTVTAIAPPASVVSPQPPPPELRTLAEVPDGQLIQYGAQDLKALLLNPAVSPSSVIVQTLSASSPAKWTLVKHEGHVYLRGYIAAMSSKALAQMKTIQIFSGRYDSSQSGGMAYVKPVTVRLDRLSSNGLGSTMELSYITVSNLNLDRYADEHAEF